MFREGSENAGRGGFSTLGDSWRRLARRGDAALPPAWESRMTMLAAGALVLAALATRIDASAIRLAMTSDLRLLAVLGWITDIGLAKWYVTPAVALFTVLGIAGIALRGERWCGWPARLYANAGFAAAAVSAPHLLVNTLKHLVGRARPMLFEEGGPFRFHPMTGGDLFASFPSGHSATCGAVAMLLALWFPRLAAPLLLAGFVFATSRVASLWHYPSDVVAGFAIGSLFALFLARWLARRRSVFRFAQGRLLPQTR